MKTITLTSILFLVLALAAIMLAGCYSGSYGDPIEPIDPACDPDVPVVLNGDTIEEGSRVYRSDEGCVVGINMKDMGITNPNCLAGIEIYHTLERLGIEWNRPPSINLTPLSLCTNLKRLGLEYNDMTSIDLTPLWELDSLNYLRLLYNNLDSASCAHVCDFIETHPDCHVSTDCDCP